MGVPLVAFFGARGGAGRHTLSANFSEDITYSESSPSVLVVDMDLYTRALTSGFTEGDYTHCPTLEDYLGVGREGARFALNVTLYKRNPVGGKLMLIPAPKKADARIFPEASGDILSTVQEFFTRAAESCSAACIVVDCGVDVNPITAAVAELADRVFLVGLNEETTLAARQEIPGRIRGFQPLFRSRKICLVVNKVRGRVKGVSCKHVSIPFIIDVVNQSEGVDKSKLDRLRLVLFDNCVLHLLRVAFGEDRPGLVPELEGILGTGWKRLLDPRGGIRNIPRFRWTVALGWLFPVGGFLIGLSVLLRASGVQQGFQVAIAFSSLGMVSMAVGAPFWKKARELSNAMNWMVAEKAEGLLKLLHSGPANRKILKQLLHLAEDDGKSPPIRSARWED